MAPGAPFAVALAVGLRPLLPGRDRGQPFRRLVGVGITPFTVLPGAVRPASGELHKADEPERSGRRPLLLILIKGVAIKSSIKK